MHIDGNRAFRRHARRPDEERQEIVADKSRRTLGPASGQAEPGGAERDSSNMHSVRN